MCDSKGHGGKLNRYEAFKEANLEKLLKALGCIEITEEEMNTLKWLSGCETERINNICSVIEKVKNKR